MNNQQVDILKTHLKNAVQKIRIEIREELLRSDNESYIDIAGRVHDAGEESVADLLNDQNIAAISHHIQELRALEAALLRISMGSYGKCEMCGNTIPFERMQVQPAATRCIECQTHLENSLPYARTPKL